MPVKKAIDQHGLWYLTKIVEDAWSEANRKLGAKERCKCALNIVGLGLDIFYSIKLGKC